MDHPLTDFGKIEIGKKMTIRDLLGIRLVAFFLMTGLNLYP